MYKFLAIFLILAVILTGCTAEKAPENEPESTADDSTSSEPLGMYELFDAYFGGNRTISDYVEFAKKLYGIEFTAEDIDNIELSGSTLTIGFGDYSLNVISPDSPIPSEVKLPEDEPALERAPSLSSLKFRYYAGDGAKFYWSRTGKIWFDCTIDLPENAENVVITDFQNGNSCEANVTLKADIDSKSTNFWCVIDAYFMPPQQISIDVIEASND